MNTRAPGSARARRDPPFPGGRARRPAPAARVGLGHHCAGRRRAAPARFTLLAAFNPCPCGWALVLAEPLEVVDGTPVSLIELIPPVHQRVYRMGLEHLGVVVGEDVDAFSRIKPPF